MKSIAFCDDFNINFDMDKSVRNLPSIRALVALERVARLGNVTRAAEELNTSQAAISRHLRQLETELGIALVTRSGRGIVLTPAGHNYSQKVADVLAKLRHAGDIAAASRNELVIACTHEVSHLVLMPRYSELKKTLGASAHIRIVTCEYQALPTMIDAGADIVFQYSQTRPRPSSAAIATEEILPVASPAVIAANHAALDRTPDHWQGIPRLFLTKENSGWATWDDWFTSQGTKPPDAPEHRFDNYVYALEAATRDEGLVLAWRGFADRYLQAGQLVPVWPSWYKSGATLYAVPTSNGLAKELARKCIKVLSSSLRPA